MCSNWSQTHLLYLTIFSPSPFSTNVHYIALFSAFQPIRRYVCPRQAVTSPSQILITAYCTALHPVTHLNLQYLTVIWTAKNLLFILYCVLHFYQSFQFPNQHSYNPYPVQFQQLSFTLFPYPSFQSIFTIFWLQPPPAQFQQPSCIFFLNSLLSSILYTSKSCSYILLLTSVCNNNFLFQHVLHSFSSHIYTCN